MKTINAPIADLRKIVDEKTYISSKIDMDLLHFFGVFILKNVFRPDTIEKYKNSYASETDAEKLVKRAFHQTEMTIGEVHFLRNITEEKEFVDIASCFFGGNVGADFIRIVRKDRQNTQAVFLHQDICYQLGGFERYSFFIPLTECNYGNGALVVYPGTHNFGYLGDAGEINEILPVNYPKIETSVSPGDILIMHSGTWHQSPENQTLADRVYLEVHIQSIDEPNTSIEICGVRKSRWILTLPADDLFKGSRAQRIKKLYGEVELLKKQVTP